VVGLVEALELEKVLLMGCSLGSAVAQRIALDKKPWLVGVGLVGAGARLRVHPSFLEGVLQDKEKALGLLAAFALSEGCRHDVKEFLASRFLKCPPELIHADLTACNEFDVTNEVNQISLPTIIIVGREDRLTPVKYSEFLHNAIPGSRLEVVPSAGHLVMMEQPEAFNRILADFLRELP
jgi:pimeloyl-ACP methyl ester carboxylesterase